MNSERREAPTPLLAVYAAKRQRTLCLVRAAVDSLVAAKERVSIAAIIAESKRLDPERNGVSKDGLLGNTEARSYYQQYRTARHQQRRRAPSREQQVHTDAGECNPVPVRANRDEARARQRYQRLTKRDLIDQLLSVEQAYAVERERWLQANDLVFWWMHVYDYAAQFLGNDCEAHLP